MKHIAEQFELKLMNYKKINSLAEQIYEADAIIVDDSEVLTNNVDIRAIGCEKDTYEVLHIDFCNTEGNFFKVVITETGLNDAIVTNDNIITLKDSEGIETTIKLLTLSKKDVNINWK